MKTEIHSDIAPTGGAKSADIAKCLALDVCAALLGMAIFGLPVLFLQAMLSH